MVKLLRGDSGVQQPEPSRRNGVIVGLIRRGLIRRGLIGTARRRWCRRSTLRFDNRHRETFFLGVRPRLLMGWPRPSHRLTGDPKPVNDLWPCPDGWALPCLRRVLDQLEESGITSTVPVRLDRHRLPLSLPCRRLVGSPGYRILLNVTRSTSPHGHRRRVKRIYAPPEGAHTATDVAGKARVDSCFTVQAGAR
jgi:hypothetical protein